MNGSCPLSARKADQKLIDSLEQETIRILPRAWNGVGFESPRQRSHARFVTRPGGDVDRFNTCDLAQITLLIFKASPCPLVELRLLWSDIRQVVECLSI